MDLFSWISSNIPSLSVVVLLLSVVFQVSKIPINPWGWLFHGVSGLITRDLNEKLAQIEKDRIEQYKEITKSLEALNRRLELTEHKEDERYVKGLRMKIIDFAGSIRNGKINSREAFEEIMRVYEEYHEILAQLNETNGYIDTEYELIKEAFKEYSKNNDLVN